jgi:hypothetical protein
MKEDGRMILCPMAIGSFVQWQQHYCHMQRWRLEGLDKDPRKVFFNSSADTSNDFIG